MNRFVSLGLTVTIALGASVLRSQDLSQPPRPPAPPATLVMPLPPEPPVEGVLAGVFDGVIDGVPGGIVGGVPGRLLAPPGPLEPPEPMEPPELIEPMEPLVAPEPNGPVFALIHPPEIGTRAQQQAFLLQAPPSPPPRPGRHARTRVSGFMSGAS